MKYCSNCGAEVNENAVICLKCGCSVNANSNIDNIDRSPKSWLATLLLCWFFGIIGVHRFYVGRIGSGIAMIITFGGLGIWTLIDLIIIICGNFRDSNGKYIKLEHQI